ncbi:hypothetical protein CONCODRAFT_69969 [Conidiobolus coronatus NRRL 28638]|uniref:Uncharacterized protein n=1 Tax=Conidiobolus coronatus (strain ATCC 28846 / CBS 209.66 / NRRL 28638) TaxID=796925 RepID=A0A137P8F8_CONC2|nr:hypothetical protein CONCODRAFT_69969 [Conidiobolus coronatus NRRL 28638]|eukprot:KXN71234.1 hypothetical protein CONCODRAFT_69969 [Conidiobolus coronatus NRRL 28638]
MLLINYIFSISATFAFTDYFANVTELYKNLKDPKEVSEVSNSTGAKQIFNSDGVQVVSLAVHGNKIEPQTEEFSKMLYERVIGTRGKSALYSFLSNIDSTESMKYNNDRCTPTHCCEEIKPKDPKKKNMSNKSNFDEKNCQKYGLKTIKVCNYEKVCYKNAAHVTSENFNTTKINELIDCRYPVSFHGYQDRKYKNGALTSHIVLGGLSNQKYKLAETFHKMSGGAFKVAVCKTAGNCRVYDENNEFDKRTKIDGSGLTGTSKDNFVNKGKGGCGLQIELATTFRNLKGEDRKHWNSLVESIFCTLPNNESEICDPERPIGNTQEDAEEDESEI